MTRVFRRLAELGARLKRQRKHLVYELPDGRPFVVSRTPSDRRAERNALATLDRLTGGRPQPSTKPSRPRRRRRQQSGPTRPEWTLPHAHSPIATALRESGLVEQQLRDRIAELERTLARNDELLTDAESALARVRLSWTVRTWAWVRGVDL